MNTGLNVTRWPETQLCMDASVASSMPFLVSICFLDCQLSKYLKKYFQCFVDWWMFFLPNVEKILSMFFQLFKRTLQSYTETQNTLVCLENVSLDN